MAALSSHPAGRHHRGRPEPPADTYVLDDADDAENAREPALWRTPHGVAMLEPDGPGCAFLEISSLPSAAGDTAADHLVHAALARARAQHLTRVRTALDASRPVCAVVLAALHREMGGGVDAVECHRSGASVMVTVDLPVDRPRGSERTRQQPRRPLFLGPRAASDA